MQQLSGAVAIGVRTCASLLSLKSIIGCSRNTRIGTVCTFPALQCVWKHIANSTVQPKYLNWKGVNFSAPSVVLPFIDLFYLTIYLLNYLLICLFIYYLFNYLFIYLFTYLFIFYLFIYLLIIIYLYLFTYLFIYFLFIYSFIYLFLFNFMYFY